MLVAALRGHYLMKAYLAKVMATLCLKLAGWLCKTQKLKIVYSDAEGRDLHVVVDAHSGVVTTKDGSKEDSSNAE